MEVFDVVELVEGYPREGLSAGSIGTIVDVYENEFEVEFCDKHGTERARLALALNQLRPAPVTGRPHKSVGRPGPGAAAAGPAPARRGAHEPPTADRG